MIDIESRSAAWANEPEPMRTEGDPNTIVETEPVSYVWNTRNETDEWLYFDGETLEIEQ